MERGREASLNSDAGRQKEPFFGSSPETVSKREPGNALFWRQISGTSEPTASQFLRRINLSFAASLKSAGKSAARRSGISEDRDFVYALVGAALRRPPCLPRSMRREPLAAVGHPFQKRHIYRCSPMQGRPATKTLWNERMRATCAGAKLRVLRAGRQKEPFFGSSYGNSFGKGTGERTFLAADFRHK